MEVQTKYKIYKVTLSKKNPLTDFNLVFKINPEIDNDFIINMILSYELYSIEKFDEIIIIEFTINIENNKFDIFVNYSVKDSKKGEKVKKEIISENLLQNEVDTIINMLKCIIKNQNLKKSETKINSTDLNINIKDEDSYNIDILELLNTSEVDLISHNHKDDMEIEKKIYYHLNLITMKNNYDINKNIIYIIIDLIKFIEHFNIKGSDKKKILIKTLDTFLKEKKYIHTEYITHIICPDLIDILISIDKRKIVLKKHLSSCLFPFS